MEAIFGVRAERLTQDATPVFSMTYPEDLAGLLSSIQQSAQALAPWHREWRVRHPERGELWVEAQSRPLPDAEGGIRWHGFVTVVTERKRLEQWASSTLKELRDLREALDHHAIVAITDAEGTITYVNENFCRISKYRREELIGQNHRILKSGVHPPAFYTGIWRSISGGNVWQGDICNRARDGSLYWVATTIVPFLDDAGVPFQYIAIRTDITAERESAAEIRRWADAFEHCAHGIAMGDPVTNRLIACNPALARLHGSAVADMVGKPIADLYPPAERPRVEAHLAESDRLGHARFESSYERADGSLVPVQVDLVTVRNEQGRPLYRIATVEDIGERRRADAAVREATDQLRAVVEASPIPIIVTDLDTRVLLWSRAASALFGYTEAEVLGQPMPIVPPDLQEGHETIRDRTRQGEHLGSYLTRRQARDGRQIEVSISTAPLHDHDGHGVGSVATYLDLTEGAELRQALRLSEARFGQVFARSPVGMMLIRVRDPAVVEVNEAFERIAGHARPTWWGTRLDTRAQRPARRCGHACGSGWRRKAAWRTPNWRSGASTAPAGMCSSRRRR
ncbi:MAG: PAS domain S-box protein [Gemmatimonadetes bacterium]|nr:PAS domain S-box protein [Gemmatimonadota bacterium]